MLLNSLLYTKKYTKKSMVLICPCVCAQHCQTMNSLTTSRGAWLLKGIITLHQKVREKIIGQEWLIKFEVNKVKLKIKVTEKGQKYFFVIFSVAIYDRFSKQFFFIFIHFNHLWPWPFTLSRFVQSEVKVVFIWPIFIIQFWKHNFIVLKVC